MLLKNHFWTGWAAHPQLHQMSIKEGDLFFSYFWKTILMYMEIVFKDKKLLLILIADLLISVSVPFLIHGILTLSGSGSFTYPFLFAIFGAINAFLSYLSGDIIIISYKKKNNIVTSSIPEDVVNRARQIRYPFIISLLVDLLVFTVFAIIYSMTGAWPLM